MRVGMQATWAIVVLTSLIPVIGCVPSGSKPKEKESRQNIMGRKTQDIGEAQPNAEQADLQAKPEQGLLAPMGAYGFAISEISKMTIKHSLELYRAETGEYPKTHDEFMKQIIQRNNIELPVLPGKRRYQYDVQQHELIVVEAESKQP